MIDFKIGDFYQTLKDFIDYFRVSYGIVVVGGGEDDTHLMCVNIIFYRIFHLSNPYCSGWDNIILTPLITCCRLSKFLWVILISISISFKKLSRTVRYRRDTFTFIYQWHRYFEGCRRGRILHVK